MGFYKGTLPLKGFYRGTQKAKALYLGTQKIRPKYVEVKYLETIAKGKVIIPYKINYKSKIRGKYLTTGRFTGGQGGEVAAAVWGVTNGTPATNNAINGFIRLLTGTGTTFNRVGWGGNAIGTIHDVPNFPQTNNVWYEMYYNLNVVSITGGGTTMSNTLTFTENWTSERGFSLFTRTHPGGYGMAFKGRIAYFNIEEDGVKTLDLIPVKSSDNKLGYLDKVSGNFYECDDQTAFVAGPEVS